jgi:ABC-type phosphate transport system substrate-binding protein
MTKETYPIVDGSTATIPLSEAVYQLATGATNEEAAEAIAHTRTTNAYYRLIEKEVDLLIVYEPSEEVVTYTKENGYRLNMKPIGKDALVFMANSSNPVESLTHEELVRIYSGTITNWKEVGGKDEELLAFQRPVNSGSQTLMQKLVMKDTLMAKGPSVRYYAEMGEILDAMVDYHNEGNTLGYSVFYYAKNMYHLPELKFMKVDGIEPSLQSVYDGTYPYTNEFYAVIREEEPVSSNAHHIFDWLTADEGQTLVKELGYVPVDMPYEDKPATGQEFTSRIPEGYRYITASYKDFSAEEVRTATVTIYQDDWEVTQVLQNVQYIPESGLVSMDTLIPIRHVTRQQDGTFAIKSGLFSVSKNDFALPPVYEWIYPLDEANGYYIVTHENTIMIIDLTGKVLFSDSDYCPIDRYYKEGEYYYINTYDYELPGGTYYKLDKDLNIVQKYTMSNYMDVRLYDEEGNLFFSNDIFKEKFNVTLNEYDSLYASYQRGDLLFTVSYGEKVFLLDKKLNFIAQLSDTIQDDSYLDLSAYYDIYLISETDRSTYERTGKFYDRNGKEIVDSKYRTYNNIIYRNYNGLSPYQQKDRVLYEVENKELRILFYHDRTEYTLDLKDWTNAYINYIWNDVFVVINNDNNHPKTRIYNGTSLLYEFDGNYDYSYINHIDNNKFLLLRMYQVDNNFSHFLLDKNSNIIYQSETPEEIISIDDNLIQLNRGNYTGVIDFNGNFIVRMLKNSMGND